MKRKNSKAIATSSVEVLRNAIETAAVFQVVLNGRHLKNLILTLFSKNKNCNYYCYFLPEF